LKGGCKLLCANLTNPTPVGATRGRGPATAGATGMSAGHRPLLVARGYGTTPVVALRLLAGHGPLRVARDRGLAIFFFQWLCGEGFLIFPPYSQNSTATYIN